MAFKNRGERGGGGVAIYLRDNLSFKEQTDLMNIDSSIEHIWVEVKGKNKNSSVLLEVFYQPDSDITKETAWIDKFETVLATVHLKWDGIMIIAGDSNIDSNTSYKQS